MTARTAELEQAGFGKAALGKQRVPTAYPWYAPAHINTAVCTPISDGEKIWVTFAQGQAACFAKGEDYGAAFTVLGRRLYHPVLRHTDSDHPSGSGTGRWRPDQLIAASFSVVDLTDPARPTPVASTNLMGTTEYPSDVYWDTWLADPKLPKAFGCGKLFNGGFGLRTSGPVACGNRFWVQSHVYLYCIGDPAAKYDWNPASRPEPMTPWRSATASTTRCCRRRWPVVNPPTAWAMPTPIA